MCLKTGDFLKKWQFVTFLVQLVVHVNILQQ